MKLKQLSTEYEYLTPKWQIYGHILLRIIAYIYFIYDIQPCKILFQ